MDTESRARLINEGYLAFNQGQYYEAHEFWEEVWDVIDPPERLWIQGLIQIATGLHKLDRQMGETASKLLRKALSKLEGAPTTLDGLDLATIQGDARALAEAIDRGERPPSSTVRLLKIASLSG